MTVRCERNRSSAAAHSAPRCPAHDVRTSAQVHTGVGSDNAGMGWKGRACAASSVVSMGRGCVVPRCITRDTGRSRKKTDSRVTDPGLSRHAACIRCSAKRVLGEVPWLHNKMVARNKFDKGLAHCQPVSTIVDCHRKGTPRGTRRRAGCRIGTRRTSVSYKVCFFMYLMTLLGPGDVCERA